MDYAGLSLGPGGLFDEQPMQAARQVPSLTRISRARDKERFIFKTPERWACLGHLSQDNNTPKLALATHREILGDRLPLFVATRYEVSGVMEIE